MAFDTNVAPPSPAALDLKPPVVQDPLQAISGIQELRARQQQMQSQALQQQELQMNLAQRKAINDAYQGAWTLQPDGTMQLDDGKLQGALAKTGHGEAIPGIMENLTKYRQSLSTLQDTNQKVAAAEADTAGRLAATVQAAKNDPTLFHTLLTDAINQKIISAQHYAPLDQMLQQALAADPTGAQATALVGKFTDEMLKGSDKQQELASARTTANAHLTDANNSTARLADEQKKLNAELPGIQADSDVKAAQAASLKRMTDADWQQQIDATLPDKNSALYQRTRAAVNFYRNQGNLKAADDAIKAAGDQLGRTETAVATAKATAPTRIEVAGEIGKNSDALKQTDAAKKEYLKSTEDLNAAQATADGLNRMIQLAAHGNTAAGRDVQTMAQEALNGFQGIRRNNPAQLNQMPGSAMDRIEGSLKGILTGIPINGKVLDDLRAAEGAIRAGAQQKHSSNVKTINGTYGTHFEEGAAAPSAQPPANRKPLSEIFK